MPIHLHKGGYKTNIYTPSNSQLAMKACGE